MKRNILVVGSLNVDLVVQADHHPHAGETILGGEFMTFPGGKGANQAVAASRLGGDTAMIGCVGIDAFGDLILSAVKNDGVDTGLIRRDRLAATGVAMITLDKNGQNTIVVASGANMQLTPQYIASLEDKFAETSVVLCQLEIPVNVVEKSFELGKKHGAITILNPAPAIPLPESLYHLVDYLVPNQTELAMLTGTNELEDGIIEIQRRGVNNVIVTLGEDGAMLACGTQRQLIPSYNVQVVDTVAAGDAFLGAFAVALSEEKDLASAVVMGSGAGAIAVTRHGAQPSIPSRNELDTFLKENFRR